MNSWAPSRYSALLDTSSTHYRREYTPSQPESTELHNKPAMPRPQNTKVKDEHLIFVKNVPADLATGSLQDLFTRYEPLRVKNVYPNSDITTVVISFKTFDEASYAQKDTDGIRIENVVLRVEMFNKHRSVRYLREERNAPPPPCVVDEEYEEEANEQPGYVQEAAEFAPLEDTRASTPLQTDGTTWAQVAKKPQLLGMIPLPAPVPSPPLHPIIIEEAATAVEEVVVATPRLTLAVPHIPTTVYTDDGTLKPTYTGDKFLQFHAMASTEVTGHEKDVGHILKTNKSTISPRKKKVPLLSVVAPWEPVDSTERIRRLHGRDCAFCQMRERLAWRLKMRG